MTTYIQKALKMTVFIRSEKFIAENLQAKLYKVQFGLYIF